eukprot:scpid57969/ scgid26575/ Probable asparagine--tRNA ligase, mitochondrial; Asparaginyl-tRNA synthetase
MLRSLQSRGTVFGRAPRVLGSCRRCSNNSPDDEVVLKGWAKSVRLHGKLVFAHISDGLSPEPMQVVMHKKLLPKTGDVWSKLNTHISFEVGGKIVDSIGPDQDKEMSASSFKAHGFCKLDDMPVSIMTRNQSLHQLPSHLRAKDFRFQAVLRMRHHARRSAQKFFDDRNFIYIDTPTLTPNDCEGGGQVFQVEAATRKDSSQFFGEPMFLTVSGQLELEMMANGIAKVYTLSPAFRAEEDTSARHLAEFRMLEAEIAFTDKLEDLTELTEGVYKTVVRDILNNHTKELEEIFVETPDELDPHLKYLQATVDKPFITIPYHDAIDLLNESGEQFQFQPGADHDLKTEHERYLIKHFSPTPVFVTDFPQAGKPFYARANDDERQTAAAFDLLTGSVCELAGGTLREQRVEVLTPRLETLGILERFQPYLESRKLGGAAHGGFGIGFDRLISHVTRLNSLIDVTPFPRRHVNRKDAASADDTQEVENAENETGTSDR